MPHPLDPFVDDPLDLLIDFPRGLFAVRAEPFFAAGGRRQERRLVALTVVHASEAAHAELHHHASRHVGAAFEVVGGAGGNIVECDFFRDGAGEQDLDAAFQFRLGDEVAVALRSLKCVAERRDAAGDDRNLMNRVGVRQAVGDERVSRLVVGDPHLLVHVHHALFLFQPGRDAFDALVELGHAHRRFFLAGGQQRGFVHQVRQVGADKSRR